MPLQQAFGVGQESGSGEKMSAQAEAEAESAVNYSFRLRRPAFMENISMSAAEKGTVSHLLMQHVPLGTAVDEEVLKRTLDDMVNRQILTNKQALAIDVSSAAAFFGSELGQRLQSAKWVRREVPFSSRVPANRVYPNADASLSEEPILIQGVIDCLFEDQRGIVLVDYKTDRIYKKNWTSAADRHRFQLLLYAEAIESILHRKVDECHVFFFDGGQSVELFNTKDE
ncbi:ATP-dependent helicase/nuclease subunit A [compost metagenome]